MTAISTLAAKIFNVGCRIGNMTPDATNPHFRSDYISLPSLLDALKEECAKEQLAFIQMPSDAPSGSIGLKTTIVDLETSELIQSTGFLPMVKNDPQAGGSAYTYLRRYSLCSAFSIGTDDDDANDASMPIPRASAQRSAPRAAPSKKRDEAPKRVMNPDAPASPAQLGFLDRLIGERDELTEATVVADAREAYGVEIEAISDLNKGQVSEIISAITGKH